MPSDSELKLFKKGLAELNLAQLDPAPFFNLLDLLTKWNRAKNLTSITQYQEMIVKHLLDSLSIVPYVSGQTIIDVGTGAGFPGLPLAIALPDKHFYLCDSNGKKTAFIMEAVRILEIRNVTLVNQRIEQYSVANSELNGSFDCIISRAFSSLQDMVEKTAHLKAPTGKWLAMKGQLHEDELAALPSTYQYHCHKLTVPYLDSERHAVEIVS